MDTKVLAAGIAGFLLGGFVVSVAASLEDEEPSGDHGMGGSATTSQVAHVR